MKRCYDFILFIPVLKCHLKKIIEEKKKKKKHTHKEKHTQTIKEKKRGRTNTKHNYNDLLKHKNTREIRISIFLLINTFDAVAVVVVQATFEL